MPPDSLTALGQVAPPAKRPPLVPLIDLDLWEGASPAHLIEAATLLVPRGAQAAAIAYHGPDLCWAAALPPALLVTEYTAPAPQFRAGMGFRARHLWLDAAGPNLAGSNIEIRRWVEFGYSEFLPDRVPFIHKANSHTTGGDNADFVRAEVAELLRNGATLDVTALATNTDMVRVIAPLTVAVKGEKRRLCFNARPFNLCEDGVTERVHHEKFKMEGAERAAKMMRPGDFILTTDFKAGYLQIPVKPWFRKFLCFEWDGRVYQFQVLPFGLATAPRAYSKLTRAVMKRWRALGIRCSSFLDDFIFFAATLEEAFQIRATVLGDLTKLGWFLSVGKCMLKPGRRAIHLVYEFCTVPLPHLRVPGAKVMAF